MDPAQRRAVYCQIGRLARRLHIVVQPAYGYVLTEVLDPLQTNRDHMVRQFAKKTGELERLDEGAALAAAITEAVSRHWDTFDASPGPVLCHNDLHEGNVLVSEHRGHWRVQGVVDVENAVAADPLLDLAKTDYYSVRGDPAKRRGLHDGYGRLGRSGSLRLELYRLYHALELYTWCAARGDHHLLPPIRSDLEHYAAALARR
jgi:aminoglycoside phosphotransferase (APT) family kinase protein